MAIILDITDWKQKGQELQHIIEEECGYQNRRGIIGTLPDVIRMSAGQYEDLCKVANIPFIIAQNTTDRIYRTKYNVMEVEVKHDSPT